MNPHNMRRPQVRWSAGTNGQGPSEPHWRPLAAVGGGFPHKTHRRVGAIMTSNFYDHGKKKFQWRPLEAICGTPPTVQIFSIGGNWHRWCLVMVWYGMVSNTTIKFDLPPPCRCQGKCVIDRGGSKIAEMRHRQVGGVNDKTGGLGQ